MRYRFFSIIPILACAPSLYALVPLDKPELQEANQLIIYSKALAVKGEVIKIGKAGLAINGSNLVGDAVRRPADALARATEIYAEYAGEKADIAIFADVITTWKVLGDYTTRIPYLRMYSKHNPDSAFAKYCRVELALAYLKTGDEEAFLQTLELLKDGDTSNQQVGFAKSVLANYYFSKGNYDLARKLAGDVITLSPGGYLEEGVDQGYFIAQAVMMQLPPDQGGQQSAKVAENAEKIVDKNLKDNPRYFFQMAETAYKTGDKLAAIRYYEEYKKRIPANSEGVALNIAGIYAEMRQYDKALAAYSAAAIQYPEGKASWKAVLKSADILQEQKKLPQALQLIVDAIPKARTPEANAWLRNGAAVYCLKNNKSKEAADYYIQLLSKYGDQDAAKGVVAELEEQSKKVRDWRGFITSIQAWLAGEGMRKGQMGSITLNVAEASKLRRMVAGLYLQNNDDRQGMRWLKTIAQLNDPKDAEWIKRDIAWYVGRTAILPLRDLSKPIRYEAQQAFSAAMEAWKLAPDTDEGMSCINAAQRLLTYNPNDKTLNRDFESTLKSMLQGPYKDDANRILLEYYEFLGDKRAIENLKAGKV